jgi:hypothetical protein
MRETGGCFPRADPCFLIKPNLKLKTKKITNPKISSVKITEYTSETLEKIEKWFAGPLTIFEKCVKYTKSGIVVEVNNMSLEALKEDKGIIEKAALGIPDVVLEFSERFLKK